MRQSEIGDVAGIMELQTGAPDFCQSPPPKAGGEMGIIAIRR